MESSNIGFKMISVVLDFRELDHAFVCGNLDKTLRAISAMMNSLQSLRRAVRAGKNALARVDIKEVVKNETESN